MLDEPGGKEHQGGQVSAPVFAGVMAGALRLMDIAPDAPILEETSTLLQVLARSEERP